MAGVPRFLPRYNLTLVHRDIMEAGLRQADIVRKSGRKLSRSRLSAFLGGVSESPRTAVQVAKVLGHPLRRYLRETALPEARGKRSGRP